MTTLININPNLLIDVEGAQIQVSSPEESKPAENLRRSSTPVSVMRAGKFPRLFNRHVVAFRR
jgi:hypothetical protein